MAIITNSIGTAGRDYNTIALWEAALPASAVTAGNSYVGQLYNDSEFDLGTSQLTFGGTTTDATHTILLTTGPGQGFKDNAGAETNGFRYNPLNGVAIKSNVSYTNFIEVDDAYVTLSNLQIKNTGLGGSASTLKANFSTGPNFTLDSCILEGGGTGAAFNACVASLDGTAQTAKNCLFVFQSDAAASGVVFTQGGTATNCTVVRPTNRTNAAGGFAVGIRAVYGNITVQNCVIAGFATALSANGHTISGSGNATDLSSLGGTGVTATGQTSLTMTTEFVQPSNASGAMDWRLKSTSVKCKDNGTNSGAPTTDIIGFPISNTTRDVGAWELQQTGSWWTFGAYQAANSSGVTATSATVTAPAGIAANDLLLMALAVVDSTNTADPGLPTLPSGWSVIDSGFDPGWFSGDTRATLAYKIATGSEPSTYSVSWAHAGKWSYWINKVTPPSGTPALDQSAAGNSANGTTSCASQTLSGLATSTDLAIVAWFDHGGQNPYTAPSSSIGSLYNENQGNSDNGNIILAAVNELSASSLASFTATSAFNSAFRTVSAAFKIASAGASVTVDFGGAIEFPATARKDASALLEYIASIRGDKASQLETIAAVSRSHASADEFVAGLSKAAASGPEFLGSMRADGFGAIEVVAALRGDVVAFTEAQSGLRSDAAVADELLAALRADQAVQSESLGGAAVAANAAALIETVAQVSVDRAVNIEKSSAARVDLGMADESLAGVARHTTVSAELLASVQGNLVDQLESLGGAAVVGNAAAPIETVAKIGIDRGAGTEATTAARADLSSWSEVLSGVVRAATLPAEAAAAVQGGAVLQAESQGGIAVSSSAIIRLETTARLNIDHRFGSEYLSGLRWDAAVYGESLTGARTNVAPSVENVASATSFAASNFEFVVRYQSDMASRFEFGVPTVVVRYEPAALLI